MSGTEEERAQLRLLVDKRKKIVLDREAGLSSKVVFNRKVALALGAPRGQVTLMQVLDSFPSPQHAHTCRLCIHIRTVMHNMHKRADCAYISER